MEETPYSDDLFKTEAPYSDTLFKPTEAKSWGGTLNDALFAAKNNPLGRVMSAMGQGASDNWGQMVEYDQQTQNYLKEQGLFNDHTKKQQSIIKTINEAWMRPAVNTVFGAGAVVTSGLAAITEGLGQTGEEMTSQAQESNRHLQGLDAVLGFSAGNWLEGATGEYLKGLASGFIPEMGFRIPEHISKARAVGAVGETTEKYLGTEPLTPKDVQARAEAVGAIPDKPIPEPSIHDIARSIAPDVFYDKDILDTKNDLLKKEIERATAARNEDPKVKAAQDEINNILNKVKGNEEKLTKKQANQLAEIKGDLETFLDTDTPEMIAAKESHAKNYQEMMDLSQDVKAAYKEAGAKLAEEPLELTDAVPSEKPTLDLKPTEADRLGAEPTAEPTTLLGEVPKAEDNHIRDDAAAKLKAAGRPEEEANLLGQLIQSRYRARAARFKGKLGTAKELYDREFPDIQRELLELSADGKTPVSLSKTELSQIKAWHGSPHKYEASEDNPFGRFQNEKVGTGQGAASYGWGHYLAEAKGTARSYARSLRRGQEKGHLLQVLIKPEKHELLDWDKPLSEQTPEIKEALKKLGITDEFVRTFDVEKLFEKGYKSVGSDADHVNYDLKHPIKNYGTILVTTNVKTGETHVMGHAGAGIERIYNSLEQAKKAIQDEIEPDSGGSGEQIYKNLVNHFYKETQNWTEAQKKASQELHKSGIPGLKYLDQLSRNPRSEESIKAQIKRTSELLEEAKKEFKNNPHSEDYKSEVQEYEQQLEEYTSELNSRNTPTHNFVIFDESNLQITDRTLEQDKLGSLTLRQGQKNLLKLFKDADASTVIHEFGHQTLEDLLQDAAHPEAPADLVKDAQAVKDYLGIKEGKKPSRKQHEQFARSFERYLMEGTAPTQELLNVFKRFKEWLTDLYHTVANLGAPLNNEIRGVFDRLLTSDTDNLLIPEGETVTAVSPRAALVEETEPGLSPEGTPKTSAEPIVDGNTEYLQKDGKFNFENIQSYGQLIQAVKQFSEMNDIALKARKGKISDADVVAAAENSGLRTSEINTDKLAQISTEDGISLASRIVGLNEYFKQNARVIHEILQNDNPTNEDMIRFAEAVSRHRKAAEVLLGVRGEWGRAGRALNEILSQHGNDAELSDMLKHNIGITYHQLRAAMQQGKLLVTNTKQVGAMVQTLSKPSRGQFLFQYLINNYISGPLTHIAYSLGNKATLMYRIFGEAPAEALIGSLKQSVSSAPLERVTWGEVQDGIHALWFGSADGWRAVKAAYKTGQQQGLQSEDLIASRVRHEVSTGRTTTANQLTRANELIKKIEDFHLSFVVNDIAKDQVRIAQGKAPRIPPHLNEIFDIVAKTEPPQSYYAGPHMATQTGVTGAIVTAPGKYLVSPIHSIDYTVSYVVEQSRLISRQARLEGAQQGWTPQQIAVRQAQLQNNTPLHIVKSARDFALDTTLMKTGNYNSWLSKFKRTMHHDFDWSAIGMGPTPALAPIQPFVSITSNVLTGALKGAFRNNVTGVLFKGVREDLRGKNGSLAQSRTMAKMSVGTMFFSAIWGLAEQGIINPPESDNPAERFVNEMSDGIPSGVRIGNMTYEVEKLGPLGLEIAFINEMHHFKDQWEKDGFIDAAGSLIYSIGHSISKVGPVSGISDFFDSIEQGGKYAENYINGFLLTLAEPYSVGMSQIAKQIDPYQREISAGNSPGLKSDSNNQGLMAALKAEWNSLKKGFLSHTPIASESLSPKIDLFGQPIPNKDFYGMYAEKVNNDPIYKAFKEIGYFPAKVQKDINGYQLSDTQYLEYAQQAGIALHQLVGNIVSLPNFSDIPPIVKHKLIVDAVRQARNQAKTSIMTTYRDIPMFSVEQQKMIAAGLPVDDDEK